MAVPAMIHYMVIAVMIFLSAERVMTYSTEEAGKKTFFSSKKDTDKTLSAKGFLSVIQQTVMILSLKEPTQAMLRSAGMEMI